MGPHLLVPVALDALVVNQADLRATAFSVAGKRYGGVSRFESIEPPPFTLGTNEPRVGVTLHWALPDGLTRGRRASNGTLVFPAVPNRWLIARLAKQSGNAKPAKAWVVESDFLGDEGTNPYPRMEPNTGVTRLGRSRTLAEWSAINAPDVQSPAGARLTALGLTDAQGRVVGAADPAFAAYVPNVQNVFAFHDDLGIPKPAPDIELEAEASFSYMVCGWYASGADGTPPFDPLNRQDQFKLFDGADWATEEKWLDLMGFFEWSVGGEADLKRAVRDANPAASETSPARLRLAGRILCHGMVYGVRWTGLTKGSPQPFLRGENSAFAGTSVRKRRLSGESNEEPSRASLPQIAIGNSTTDALAALIEFMLGKEDSGVDMATLFQAIELGVANVLDEPGALAELEQTIHQGWFNSESGGSLWEVAPAEAGQGAEGAARSVELTAEQVDLLRRLNREQLDFDRKSRSLKSAQLNLYMRWWKSRRLAVLPLPPGVNLNGREPDAFYDLSGAATEVETLRAAVNRAKTARDSLRTQLEASLDAKKAKLVESGMPRFWRPADPVVLIYGGRASARHGGDGRFLADGKLFCRFSGQQIRRFQIGSATVVADSFLNGLFPAVPAHESRRLPEPVAALLSELALLNPDWADQIAKLPGVTETVAGIRARQEMIWQSFSPATSIGAMTQANGFIGARPSPVALEAWAQPWTPLFLSWRVTWYPSSTAPANVLGDWSFAGQDYKQKGIGRLDQDNSLVIEGRSTLAATSTSLTDNLDAVLELSAKGLTEDQKEARKQLVEELKSADLLAQPLTGFHDQLIMRDPSVYYTPSAQERIGEKSLVALLNGGPKAAPVPHNFGSSDGHFYPVRAGHFRLDRLWIVDGFGQVFDPIKERGQTPGTFAPLRGKGLVTVGKTQRTDTQALQFPPRLIQPARLLFRFVEGEPRVPPEPADVGLDPGANSPVCGWILPNHFDKSLTVFDGSGASLGALLLTGGAAKGLLWQRTVAGTSAVNDPADIPHPQLRQLILGLTGQPKAGSAFTDLMAAIDSTLWTTEPLGRRGDNLSILIGRPIAVVRAQIELELGEDPAARRLWRDRDNRQTRGFTAIPFAVQVGQIDLRSDGTLGYFEGTDYRKFLAVHPNLALEQESYVQDAGRHRDLTVTVGQKKLVTVLLDPRGSVHARCGILPAKALRLPGRFVDKALERMDVTFRVGPVLNEPHGIRMPLPVNVAGSWSWIAQTGVELNEIETVSDIAPATQEARLGDTPLHIREGYLKLSDAVRG